MNLLEKIKSIYPTLTDSDFFPNTGTIFIQNDSDEKGDYIKFWTNNNPQPTTEQLTGITQ
jgi:hypothetical protein